MKSKKKWITGIPASRSSFIDSILMRIFGVSSNLIEAVLWMVSQIPSVRETTRATEAIATFLHRAFNQRTA